MSEDKRYIVALINGDGHPYDVLIKRPVEECYLWITDDGTLVIQEDKGGDVVFYAAPGKWHSVRRVSADDVK